MLPKLKLPNFATKNVKVNEPAPAKNSRLTERERSAIKRTIPKALSIAFNEVSWETRAKKEKKKQKQLEDLRKSFENTRAINYNVPKEYQFEPPPLVIRNKSMDYSNEKEDFPFYERIQRIQMQSMKVRPCDPRKSRMTCEEEYEDDDRLDKTESKGIYFSGDVKETRSAQDIIKASTPKRLSRSNSNNNILPITPVRTPSKSASTTPRTPKEIIEAARLSKSNSLLKITPPFSMLEEIKKSSNIRK